MKTINLFLDMEFTSLSPDAQPISIGIVSDEVCSFKRIGKSDLIISDAKSFYAEFSDFNINKCDDWVKENVVEKLKFDCPTLNGITQGELSNWAITDDVTEVSGDTDLIKEYLRKWLSQFSDYKCVLNVKNYSCVYPLLELIGVKYIDGTVEMLKLPDFFEFTINFLDEYRKNKTRSLDEKRGWNYDHKYFLKKHLNQMERDYGYESSDHEVVKKNMYSRLYIITYDKKNQKKHFTSLEGAMVLRSIYNRFFKSEIIFQ